MTPELSHCIDLMAHYEEKVLQAEAELKHAKGLLHLAKLDRAQALAEAAERVS